MAKAGKVLKFANVCLLAQFRNLFDALKRIVRFGKFWCVCRIRRRYSSQMTVSLLHEVRENRHVLVPEGLN